MRYFFLALGVWCVAAPALGDAIPTTGIYDENVTQPNTIDFVASGSTRSAAEFAGVVADAFAHDMGGVINCSTLGLLYSYGVQQNKTLRIDYADGTRVGIGSPLGNPTTISGTGAFASTSAGGYDFTSVDFTGIDNGLPGERVVEFGLTALSITGRDYGTVTVEGRLDLGGSLIASSLINHSSAAGDTLFALTAPAGRYFTGFSLAYSAAIVPDVRLWFDDVAFVTAVVPEPGTFSLMGLASGVAGLLMLRRRRRDCG